MKMYRLPDSDLELSRMALGCMNSGGGWNRDPLTDDTVRTAEHAVMTAVECGINIFDHADIYTLGKSEEVFGRILDLHPDLRDRIIVQDKCGIRFGDARDPLNVNRYDFSREHILHSVEQSLRRLRTDRLDILLLHRPDALSEPAEIAAAFDELHASGKVRHFGVSNHTPARLALLQSVLRQPLVVNQIELNLLHTSLIDEEIVANTADAPLVGHAGTIDYARIHGILLQAWSPLAKGRAMERSEGLRNVLQALSARHGVGVEALLIAWLLRHPAGIQPVIGTTQPDRIRRCCEADRIHLSREEWYALYSAARGKSVP